MDNALELSDEDFLNAPDEETPEEESAEEALSQEEEAEEEEPTSGEEVAVEDEELGEEEETPQEEESSPELDSTEESLDTIEEEVSEVDFTEAAKKIFEPFKANGTEVQIKTADEAIQLMQMGANYTQEMQALQPNLKVLKMLEQQDLLSEEKLSFLIDLSKNDPKAIAKLVQDSKIDPLSLEPVEGEEYVPQDYSVPNETIQLESVLSEIENTPTYSKCIDVVGNQWDNSSKQALSQNPIMIKQLNEQMQAGIFDQINQEVVRLKMFGGLRGLSDFDAYKQVGSQLYESRQLVGTKPKSVAKTKVASTTQNTALAKKRRAASTPKNSSKSVSRKEGYNPLAMSDEEFLKTMNQQYK